MLTTLGEGTQRPHRPSKDVPPYQQGSTPSSISCVCPQCPEVLVYMFEAYLSCTGCLILGMTSIQATPLAEVCLLCL